MSHFPVAVIVHDGASLDDLLAPYQENNMGDCPKKYMEFVDTEDKHRGEYETGMTEKVKTPDGRLLEPFDEEFRVPGTFGFGTDTHKVPEGAGYEKVDIKFTELYSTFEEYMADYHGYDERDPDTGKYGYWENPNAKWDWWQIGGRYSNWFETKDGRKVSDCKVRDMDRTPDEAAREKALRFWEIVVEGSPMRPGEEKPFNFYTPSYYLEQYGTKEEYAAEQAGDAPWAFITPDGVWHEKGEMGWFAAHDANQDTRRTFNAAWEEAIAATAPDDWVVLVDCHI